MFSISTVSLKIAQQLHVVISPLNMRKRKPINFASCQFVRNVNKNPAFFKAIYYTT